MDLSTVWYILQGVVWTVAITVVSFALGALGGVGVAAARVSARRWVRIIARGVLDIIRSVPPLVWLFIVYFGLAELGLRFSPFQSAIITFSIIASVYLGEIYRGGLAALGAGQIEAAKSIGLGRPTCSCASSPPKWCAQSARPWRPTASAC